MEAKKLNSSVKTAHTPTPWAHDGEILFSESAKKEQIAQFYDYPQWVDDATHIVKCVNMFPQLVETLETLLENIEKMDTSNNSRRAQEHLGEAEILAHAVLKKAKGESC